MMMSVDGASFGILPHDAVRAVIGGKDPAAEPLTVDGLRAAIEAVPDNPVEDELEDSYNAGAMATAKVFLRWLTDHPGDAKLPLLSEWEWSEDGRSFKRDAKGNVIVTREGLYDKVKAAGGAFPAGLTGFQVGWAFNAARAVLGLGERGNPAIVEVG